MSLFPCLGTTHLSNPSKMEQKNEDPVRFSASSLDRIKAEEDAYHGLEKPWIFWAPDDF